jgi:hypothetical protein
MTWDISGGHWVTIESHCIEHDGALSLTIFIVVPGHSTPHLPTLAIHLVDNRQIPPTARLKRHTRAQSKSSISSNLSRRSSAEFSAKQASLVGADDELNSPDNWEVRVSKEFLHLSLGQDGRDEGKTSEFQKTDSGPVLLGHTFARGASVGRIKVAALVFLCILCLLTYIPSSFLSSPCLLSTFHPPRSLAVVW